MPGIDVTCIPATTADLPALGAWMHAFYAEEGLVYSPSSAGALETLVGDASLGRAVVVHTPAGAAGYFILTYGYSLERGGRVALLDELFVLPLRRGQGVGKGAIAAAARLAREAGCRALLLEVDRANARAGRLYRQAGFTDHNRDFLSLPLPQP